MQVIPMFICSVCQRDTPQPPAFSNEGTELCADCLSAVERKQRQESLGLPEPIKTAIREFRKRSPYDTNPITQES